MTLIRGQGFGSGSALGRAALLGDQAGRPTLDANLLTQAEMNLRRGNEPFDIVFIAEDAARALLLPLPPGLHLVGILADRPATLLQNAAVPVICGLPGVQGTITEGSLILVDAPRGRAIVDPSAQDIARLQSGNARPRYSVGANHVPAVTQSGRTVAVWATAFSLYDLETAEEFGADGLLVYPGGDLLPEPDAPADMALATLRTLAERWGNGDIALCSVSDLMDARTICRFAPYCRLRWVLRPEELPLTPRELRTELAEICREEEDFEGLAAIPYLVSLGSLGDLESSGWDELITPPDVTDHDPLEILSLPPVFALLSGDLADLPAVVTVGASGIIVPPQSVADAKYRIREIE